MADIFFADISNFQDSADLATYRRTNAVVICQINWGTSVTVPSGRIALIRSLKFEVVVWYVGLVATEDIAAQVSAFLSAIGPLQPGETVCIDWESTPGQGTPSASQRDQAATLIGTGLNIPVSMVGIYASPSNLSSAPPLGWSWVAAYEEPEPSVAHVFWQFTDGVYTSGPYPPVNFPGIGFCDGSVFHGPVAQLAAAIVPNAAPAPAPPPTEEFSMLLPPVTLANGSDIIVQVGADKTTVYGKGRSGTTPWQQAANKVLGTIIPGTAPEQRISGTQYQCFMEQASDQHVLLAVTSDGVAWDFAELP